MGWATGGVLISTGLSGRQSHAVACTPNAHSSASFHFVYPWVFKISLRCASGGVGLVVRCGQLRLVYECQAALRRPIGIIDLHAHTCSEFNFVRMDRTQCTYQQCRRRIDDGDENVACVGDHHHDAHSTRACSHTRTQTPGQAQVKHL